jgi:hypothetical protein
MVMFQNRLLLASSRATRVVLVSLIILFHAILTQVAGAQVLSSTSDDTLCKLVRNGTMTLADADYSDAWMTEFKRRGLTKVVCESFFWRRLSDRSLCKTDRSDSAIYEMKRRGMSEDSCTGVRLNSPVTYSWLMWVAFVTALVLGGTKLSWDGAQRRNPFGLTQWDSFGDYLRYGTKRFVFVGGVLLAIFWGFFNFIFTLQVL